MRCSLRGRSSTLESQVIYGPVVILVGARVTATRPCPRTRRADERSRTVPVG